MKKLLLSAFVAFAMLASTKTLAQQGFGTNIPSKSAAVDIVSSQRGLLVPRLDLSNITVASPVDAPAHGLLVYNKATSALTGADVANNVTPGFYYWERNNTTSETAWQGKWVRIVSSNTEKKVVVKEGNNVKVVEDVTGLATTYIVSVDGGTKNGQVLVSVPNRDPATVATEPFVSEWVDPDDFIKGVNGIDVTTDPTTGVTNVGLGGALNKNTDINATGYNLSITGLPTLSAVTSENVMVMDANGILKQVSLGDLLAAKDLTLENELEFTNNTNGEGAVLVATQIGIKDRAVGSEKLNPGTAIPGQIATVIETTPGDATTKVVQYQNPSTAIGQPLTTDNIIGVGADATAASATTANLLNGAVLTPTYLKIKDDAIAAAQIAENAVGASELADNSVASANIIDGSIANADLGEKSVSANKLTSTVTNAAGVVTTTAPAYTVPTADGSGGITYQTIAAAAGEDLTTDGKIVIGSTNATTLTDAVLVPTRLSIAAESITSADIKDGTIKTTDIKAPNSSTDNNLDGDENMVMVTDTNGDVTWIAQSSLANKDNYNFTTPLAKDAGTANTKGGTDYTVSIATASATTLGVVKQSAATGEEITIATDGSLSINEANVTVGTVSGSDVTGQLNDLTVAGIQGTAVSAIAPTAANNMLVYNSTTNQWEPSTVATAAGKSLTGAGITVTSGANATPGTTTSLASAVLADVTLGIADNAITSLKIADGAVSNVDVAPLAISPDKMTTYTTANGTATPAVPGTVATAGPNGTVSYQTTNSLVTVNNGLNKTYTDIELGGTLKRATKITTNGSTDNTFNLAIENLVVPANATSSEIVYSQTADGVLRKAARSISQYVEASQVVNAISGYNDFVQEINITAKIVSGDINITLPTATATNKGQVVNVKIVNTAEVADYLNILVGSTTLTYGALPYQSWIIKSNGTTWEIVGRN